MVCRATGHGSTLKRREILTRVPTRMDLEDVTPVIRGQGLQDSTHMRPLKSPHSQSQEVEGWGSGVRTTGRGTAFGFCKRHTFRRQTDGGTTM